MELAMQQTSPRFWNWMARRYARSPISDEASYRHKLEVTQSYMRPDMKVMEFGCGSGGTAQIHAPHVAEYLATDFSDAMIAIARERASDAGLGNLRFEVASIEEMAQTRWDMVLGLSILHLLKDRRGVIAKVHDMLEPGGYFVSSTVCLGDMAWALRAFMGTASALRIFPHIDLLRGDALVRDLKDAGFEIEYQWRPGPDKALLIVARKPG